MRKINDCKRKVAIMVLSFAMVLCALGGCATAERWSVSKTVVSTCVTGGYTEYVSNFGNVKTGNQTAPLTHNWVLIDEKDPLCEAKGSKTYECSNCKEIKVEYEDPNGHEYGIIEVVEPDCDHGGYTLKGCVCGKTYKENFTAALGHDWRDNGALSSSGVTRQRCEVCGDERLKSDIELGLNWEFAGFDFENQTFDGNWQLSGYGKAEIIYAEDLSSNVLAIDKYSGKSSVSVLSKAVAVNPGKVFNLSFNFKGDNTYNRAVVSVYFCDSEFRKLDTKYKKEFGQGMTSWNSLVTDDYIIPEDAQFCIIEMTNIESAGSAGNKVYYDNVKINYLADQQEGTIENDEFLNSDFETAGVDGLIGWTVIGSDKSKVNLVQNTFDGAGTIAGTTIEGVNSLHINSLQSVHAVRSPMLLIEAGVHYDISVQSVRYYTYGSMSMRVDFYQSLNSAQSIATYEDNKNIGREYDGKLVTLAVSKRAPINARYLTITLTVNKDSEGFFDKVKVVANTEKNIVSSINMQVINDNVGGILPLMQKDVVNIQNVNSAKYMMKYYVAMKDAINEKGGYLTKSEIQDCVNEVNLSPENYTVDSILENGDFEQVTDGKPDGWSVHAYKSSGEGMVMPVLSINNDYVSNGNNSIKFYKEMGGSTGVTSGYIPVEVGSTYYVSVDTFAIGFEPNLYLSVRFYTDKGVLNEDYNRTAKKQSRDRWLSLGMLITIPDDILYVTVGVSSTTSVTVCTCYADNFEFRKVTRDDMTAEFNRLLRNEDIYQIRNLLQAPEFIEDTGFRMDRLNRYIHAFKNAQKQYGSVSCEQIKQLIDIVDADIDAYDQVIIQDVISQAKTQLIANKIGYVTVPELLEKICDENYVIYKFVSGEQSPDYCKVIGDGLFVYNRPNATGSDFNGKASIKFILGDVEIIEEFDLTILKYATIEEETLNKLTFDVIKGENSSQVAINKNLELPTTYNGVRIFWSSTNSEYITDDGIVTLAEYGDKQAVTLTAYIDEENMKDFNFVVESQYQKETEKIEVRNSSFEKASDVSLGNYSFKRADNERVDGWTRSSNFGNLQMSDENAYSGNYSLKIMPEADLGTCFVFADSVFNVTEEARYRASVMVYTEEAEAWPGIYLEFYNINSACIDVAAVEYDYTKLGTWQLLTVDYKAPTGAVFVRIQLYSCAAHAYFDDVMLEKLPQVDNGDFANGLNAWSDGSVQNGELTLNNGQMAVSVPDYSYGKGYPATYGLDYLTFANVKGKGAVEIAFYGESDNLLDTYTKEFNNATYAQIILRASAPKNSYSYSLKLLASGGTAQFKDVSVYNAPYGAQTVDGSFENGESLYWTMNDAYISNAYVVDGQKGVTICAGGNLVSKNLVVLAGKTYYFTAHVESGAYSGLAIQIDYYDKWKTPKGSTVIDQPTYEGLYLKQEFIPNVETAYAVATFKAGNKAVNIDCIELRAVSTSISNAQFESLHDALFYSNGFGGSALHQWSVYGELSANGITGLNFPDGMVAARLVGEGIFRSSYTIAEENVKYEGRIYAKNSSGTINMTLSFYDGNFNLISTQTNYTTITASEWKEFAVTANSPAGTAYYTMDIIVDGNVTVDHASVYEYVRKVGSVTQTFMDDYIIESSTGLEMITHQAQVSDVFMYNSQISYQNVGGGMYGTIMYDKEEGKYKLWYQSRTNYDDIGYGQSYAESYDGINWTLPVLNQYQYAGSTDNNVFAGRYRYHSFTVYKDCDNPDPEKRYQGIICYLGEDDDTSDGITRDNYYWTMYSPDGINWNIDKMFLNYHDVCIMSHDDENDLFVVVAKCVIECRDMHNLVVKDLDDLDKVIPIKMNSVATPLDGLDIYMPDSNDVTVLGRNGTYIGWSNVITLEDGGLMNGSAQLKMLFSRDLTEDWYRPTYEEMVESKPQDTTYLGGFKPTSNNWLYTEDTMTLLISGSICGQWEPKYVGDVDNYGTAMMYLTWRTDGFISMRATELGTLTTKAMEFDGNLLNLNATVNDGGKILVEVLDEDGNVIDGYSKDDCDAITGDSTRLVVSFNGNSDLSGLADRNVRLRFYVENADLYTFTFVQNV